MNPNGWKRSALPLAEPGGPLGALGTPLRTILAAPSARPTDLGTLLATLRARPGSLRIPRAVVAFLLAGCGFGENPIAPRDMEPRVVVHSVLQAGADTVAVLLTRTASHFRQGPSGPADPLTGASVRIIADGDTLQLTEQSAAANRCGHHGAQLSEGPGGKGGVGCYLAALPGGVRAGESYELVIDHPEHSTIQGRATVPTPPALHEPVALVAIEVGTNSNVGERLEPLHIRWSNVEPGRRLELTIRTGEEGCWVAIQVGRRHGDLFGVELTGLDSAAVVRRWIHCGQQELADSYPAYLYLTAFDGAYTAYQQKNTGFGSTPQAEASMGVVGALGVFAGAATTRIPITLQVRQDRVGALP